MLSKYQGKAKTKKSFLAGLSRYTQFAFFKKTCNNEKETEKEDTAGR